MGKLLSVVAAIWRQRAEIRDLFVDISLCMLDGARRRIRERTIGSFKHIFSGSPFKIPRTAAGKAEISTSRVSRSFSLRPRFKSDLGSRIYCRAKEIKEGFGPILYRVSKVGDVLRPAVSHRLSAFGALMGPAVLQAKKVGNRFGPVFYTVRSSNAALAVGLGFTLFASGCGLWMLAGPRAVVVNGATIAVAGSEADYRTALEKALALKTKELSGMAVEVTDQVELGFSFASNVAGEQELVNILASQLNCVSMATAIAIDGQPKLLLASEAEAQTLLDTLKAKYLDQYPAEDIRSAEFAEAVTLIPIRASIGDVLSADQAMQRIAEGEQKAIEYSIKEGDSLWVIARRNDLMVSDLLQANPGLDEERLQAGQKIRLMNPEPLISVVATLETKDTRPIAFETEVKPDEEHYRGYTKVIKAGVLGSKEVMLQVVSRNGQWVEETVLSETVLQQPENQVELRGTRNMVASRGSTGSGRLGWPLRGTITSRFGGRKGGYHTGLDIDGNTGDPICAAEDGTVIEAQWLGGYGRELVIDHGGGMLTRYAHCSALLVKRGDKVSRGQIIARVGSTGNSTGSHLHFEVIVNGVARNPANYLN